MPGEYTIELWGLSETGQRMHLLKRFLYAGAFRSLCGLAPIWEVCGEPSVLDWPPACLNCLRLDGRQWAALPGGGP